MFLLFSFLRVAFLLISHQHHAISSRSFPETIKVDLDHPEQHGPFMIIHFVNERHGILHEGYDISMSNCNIDDIQSNRFKATLYGEHEIMVELPSVDNFFLREETIFDGNVGYVRGQDDRIREAHAIARNNILEDSSRQKQHILLCFPEDKGELSSEFYSPETREGGAIDYRVSFFTKTYPMAKVSSTTAMISWKVSLKENQRRIIRANSSPVGANKLMEAFSSMKM